MEQIEVDLVDEHPQGAVVVRSGIHHVAEQVQVRSPLDPPEVVVVIQPEVEE